MADAPQRDDGGQTAFTPVSTDLDKLELRADYFASPIDLDLIQFRELPFKVLGTDPLILSGPQNAHVVVRRFGAVVFWRCGLAVYARVLERIQQVMGAGRPSDEVRDTPLVGWASPRSASNSGTSGCKA